MGRYIRELKKKTQIHVSHLKTKDVDVQEKATKDFSEIDFGRTFSSLRKVSMS